jgi:hypothetical protein
MKIILNNEDLLEWKVELSDLHITNITDQMAEDLFYKLPDYIQGNIFSWGFSDSVIREKIANFIIMEVMDFPSWQTYVEANLEGYVIPIIELANFIYGTPSEDN